MVYSIERTESLVLLPFLSLVLNRRKKERKNETSMLTVLGVVLTLTSISVVLHKFFELPSFLLLPLLFLSGLASPLSRILSFGLLLVMSPGVFRYLLSFFLFFFLSFFSSPTLV